MTVLTESAVKRFATQARIDSGRSTRETLCESGQVPLGQPYDVFLSHSSAEPEEFLLGVKKILEDQGLTVYVDKYTDPHLSPDRVTPETAALLRVRLRNSRTLMYVHSHHSQTSRWMPWELGFFDGFHGKVSILPVLRDGEFTFNGEEFLGLYPYVDFTDAVISDKKVMWVNAIDNSFLPWSKWITGV